MVRICSWSRHLWRRWGHALGARSSDARKLPPSNQGVGYIEPRRNRVLRVLAPTNRRALFRVVLELRWRTALPERLELWSLDDHRAIDPARVGPKAATLAMLKQQGVLVPDGYCLPWTDQERVPVRPEDVARVADVVEELTDSGVAPVIVRSSATCEDGDAALFAGRFESILDNFDTQSVIHAIVYVNNSLHSQRVRDYAECLGADLDSVKMSTIVQRQVIPEYSGAYASQSPRDPNCSLIELVPGHCAEALKGDTQPISIEISQDGDALATHRVDHAVVDDTSLDDVIQAVKALAERVLSLSGKIPGTADPMEFEWGYKSGECWLFQARKTRHVVANLKQSLPAEPRPAAPLDADDPKLRRIAPYGLKAWSADYFRRLNMGPKGLVTIHPHTATESVTAALAKHIPSHSGSTIRFSNPENEKGLPRAFVPNGEAVAPAFLGMWGDRSLYGIVHEYVPVDHSFEAYFDEGVLIVEHVPGLWESDNRLPPDVFVFERGEPPTIYRFQGRRMANMRRPGMNNMRQIPPLGTEQAYEWAGRFVKLFRRIRSDLLTKLPMPLNVHFIGTQAEWRFLNIRPTPPLASSFSRPNQFHVVNRLDDLRHWDGLSPLLLQISIDRGSEAAMVGRLAVEIRRRWANIDSPPVVYVPFGLLSHPALVLREFGVAVQPFFSGHSIEQLDGLFW